MRLVWKEKIDEEYMRVAENLFRRSGMRAARIARDVLANLSVFCFVGELGEPDAPAVRGGRIVVDYEYLSDYDRLLLVVGWTCNPLFDDAVYIIIEYEYYEEIRSEMCSFTIAEIEGWETDSEHVYIAVI